MSEGLEWSGVAWGGVVVLKHRGGPPKRLEAVLLKHQMVNTRWRRSSLNTRRRRFSLNAGGMVLLKQSKQAALLKREMEAVLRRRRQ